MGLLGVSVLLTVCVLVAGATRQPNILVIVADDVGFADVSYNNPSKAIPTQYIDEWSRQGIRLTNNYVQSTCTPSRAALMTGRYSANTGLVFAMLPGSLEGLPADLPTMPQVLRRYNYSAHAVGKWHVGHAKWSQTPVGRGFETHTGSYLWSMDYWSKEIFAEPWAQFGIDWVQASENGSYTHRAPSRHSTEVITNEAVRVIAEHSARHSEKPLFLYTAFTAAHAPLQPLPYDRTKACLKLPHPWRQEFCALMQGLDRSVDTLVNAAANYLGRDTVVVFTSDNGGAPFFGGQNYPLRGAKTTPFEGGVRVPGFVVDLSDDKHFLGRGGRTFDGLVHISDWLPTLASLAGASTADLASMGLDGMDLSAALKTDGPSPRSKVLLEMYYGSEGEFIFPHEDVAAFRKGRYKLIESAGMRDSNWYTEPSSADYLNTSDTSLAAYAFEWIIRYLESWTSAGKFDSIRDMLVHVGLHQYYSRFAPFESVALFDLETDPEETRNLAAALPDVVADIRSELAAVKARRPPQAKFWMTIDRDQHWLNTLKPGDCSLLLKSAKGIDDPELCRFIHPWVAEDADTDSIELVNGADSWPFIRNVLTQIMAVVWKPLLLTTAITLLSFKLI